MQKRGLICLDGNPSSNRNPEVPLSGHDGFLPLQEEVVGNVLAGRDSLVLMPTGSGKSLCYQLPAVMLDGVTLVVSPLIALMKDQVDALKSAASPPTSSTAP